jgi:hypothetical protein
VTEQTWEQQTNDSLPGTLINTSKFIIRCGLDLGLFITRRPSMICRRVRSRLSPCGLLREPDYAQTPRRRHRRPDENHGADVQPCDYVVRWPRSSVAGESPCRAGAGSYNSRIMKDSDVIVLEEPKLTLADQFYLPQVLNGLGTTMKHMLNVVVRGKDRVIQYPGGTARRHPGRTGRHVQADLPRCAPTE